MHNFILYYTLKMFIFYYFNIHIIIQCTHIYLDSVLSFKTKITAAKPECMLLICVTRIVINL